MIAQDERLLSQFLFPLQKLKLSAVGTPALAANNKGKLKVHYRVLHFQIC